MKWHNRLVAFAKPFAEGLVKDSIGLTEGFKADASGSTLCFVENPLFLKIAMLYIFYKDFKTA